MNYWCFIFPPVFFFVLKSQESPFTRKVSQKKKKKVFVELKRATYACMFSIVNNFPWKKGSCLLLSSYLFFFFLSFFHSASDVLENCSLCCPSLSLFRSSQLLFLLSDHFFFFNWIINSYPFFSCTDRCCLLMNLKSKKNKKGMEVCASYVICYSS